jgi:hypothetical protein
LKDKSVSLFTENNQTLIKFDEIEIKIEKLEKQFAGLLE